MTFLHKNVNNVYIGYSQVSINFEGSKIYDPPSNQQCDISLEVWDSAVQSSTENLMTEQLLQEGLCVYIYIYIYEIYVNYGTYLFWQLDKSYKALYAVNQNFYMTSKSRKSFQTVINMLVQQG